MLTQQELKQNAARAALDYVLPQLGPKVVLGVGTGSTVDLFIDELAAHKHAFRAAVSSSERSAARLRGHGITVLDLNQIDSMPRSEEHTSELQSLMRISYAVFCLKKNNTQHLTS